MSATTTTLATPNPQTQSSLFCHLPAEIRSSIFSHVLAPCESLTTRYPRNCLWNRPGHFAPLRTYTEILQTCKRIHSEAWYLLYKHTSLTLYLASFDRRPANSINPFVLEEQLSKLKEPLEAEDVQVFVQLFMLEDGDTLQDVLDLPNLEPRRVCVTVRHTDFWFWESDHPLRVRGRWVERCRFPESVREVEVRFETLERKREQVEILGKQAREGWVFERKDGRSFRFKGEGVERWTGSSTLNQMRWIRDEVRPGELDYVVKSMAWEVERKGDEMEVAERERRGGAQGPDLSVPADKYPQSLDQNPCLHADELRAAGVPKHATAEEAVELCQQYRRSERGHRNLYFLGHTDEAAVKEGDEDDEGVVDEMEDRELAYSWIPGHPDADTVARDSRFGGGGTRYYYQFYERKFKRWLRLREQDEAAAEAVKGEWFPFEIPSSAGGEWMTTDTDDEDLYSDDDDEDEDMEGDDNDDGDDGDDDMDDDDEDEDSDRDEGDAGGHVAPMCGRGRGWR
ncbi:hypothetical protein B9Z65_9257 [Elsinoe australis]|uniref:F-box domain-containing protein n=1 Tax=Elsinoe australis TaxID=40998 RepID=A0A2P7Z0Z2_9PEZI|nr:hypothetical protein B9Z65_9257 [Elsinoe australis]